MRLTVLGSSGGWPSAGKPCSGYLLQAGDRKIWLDAGTGTMSKLLRYVTLQELDAVWISHLHPDHCSDLLGAYQSLTYGTPRAKPLPVLGPPGWAARFDAFLGGSVADVFEVHELVDGASWSFWPLTLQAVAVPHMVPTFGLRAERKGMTLAYTADTDPDADFSRLAAGTDLLVAEAWRSSTAVAACAQAHGVGHLVLTHMHPDVSPEALASEAAAVFSGRISVARPGDVFPD